jgi:hypothetical protein
VKIAFWLTSLGQVLLLAFQYEAPAATMAQALLGAIAIAVLWHARRLLPPHADMLLIMSSMGGFGMLAAGFGTPLCHHSWPATAGMLLLSVPASLRYARCLQGLSRASLLAALFVDMAGMITGMEMAHRLAMQSDMWHMHLAMMIGMNLGMLPRLALPALRSRPLPSMP